MLKSERLKSLEIMPYRQTVDPTPLSWNNKKHVIDNYKNSEILEIQKVTPYNQNIKFDTPNYTPWNR